MDARALRAPPSALLCSGRRNEGALHRRATTRVTVWVGQEFHREPAAARLGHSLRPPRRAHALLLLRPPQGDGWFGRRDAAFFPAYVNVSIHRSLELDQCASLIALGGACAAGSMLSAETSAFAAKGKLFFYYCVAEDNKHTNADLWRPGIESAREPSIPETSHSTS